MSKEKNNLNKPTINNHMTSDDMRIVGDFEPELINEEALCRYIQNFRNRKNISVAMTDEEIMRISGITIDNKLTMAGAFAFSLYPQMYYPRLYISATTVSDTIMDNEKVTNHQKIDGTISQMLEGAISFIGSNTAVRTKIDSATGKRQNIPEYPTESVREAVINALVHRDYGINNDGISIQLIIYKNRIEIINPGQCDGIKADMPDKIKSDIRNPVLYSMLENMGIIQNEDSGIAVIKRAMKEANLPEPLLENINDKFKVTLFNDYNDNPQIKLLEFCRIPRSRKEIIEYLGIKNSYYAFNTVVKPLVETKQLWLTIPDRPQSSNQKYVTTHWTK